jgi:Zn-dependent peptidase ImmA (M78 family)
MLLAHELCHLVHDRDRRRRIALAEGDWAPPWVEQRARGFAVMLLLPADGIRRFVAEGGGDPATPDGLRALADRFGVSWTAAARHLANLGWIPGGVDGADELVEQAAGAG